MKFAITVKNVQTGNVWEEEYDKPITDPETWGKNVVQFFNSGLRTGESPREFISAHIIDAASQEEHAWAKTNVATIRQGGRIYDTAQCTRCGITSKRFGLGGYTLDPKYRAKVYQRCDASKAHLEKCGKLHVPRVA